MIRRNTCFTGLIKSVHASVGIVIGGVLNIGLDPLFMFVILEPGNEALVAALATMISNLGALIYFLILIVRWRHELVLSVRPGRAMFADHIPRKVVSVGIPACLMTLCENISYAVLDNLMYTVGTAAQACVGVAKKVNMLTHSVVRGMAQGVLPLIVYNFASGNRRRMRRTVALSATMSIAISCVCLVICTVFTGPLIGIFLKAGTESYVYGERFLQIFCIGAPFSVWAYTVISFFQATGSMMKSLVLALMRKGILDIPLMFILHAIFPIYGVVCATPVADILCCIMATVFFVLFIKKHGHDQLPDVNVEQKREQQMVV